MVEPVTVANQLLPLAIICVLKLTLGAIAGTPKLILADEPTGALDSTTSLEIMKILNDLNETGITIVLVTHEDDIAKYGSRIIKMKDGKIIEDKKNVSN